MKNVIKDFYQEKLKKDGGMHVLLEGVRFKTVKEGDNGLLTQLFLEEEIKSAIWHCDGSKSPGQMI